MPILKTFSEFCVQNLQDFALHDNVTKVELRSLQVREVAKEAIDRARRGEGPTLIEAETYRFRGHSLADPDELRLKSEKEAYAVSLLPPAHVQFKIQSLQIYKSYTAWSINRHDSIILTVTCMAASSQIQKQGLKDKCDSLVDLCRHVTPFPSSRNGCWRRRS